jgi:biopolymer transport protein ExbD
MVITPMLQNKVNVQLAQTDNPTAMPDADKEDAVLVAVTRDGRIFLGQNQVSEADLSGKVRDALADKTSKQIFIRADTRAKYGTVTSAIDDVRTAGVDEVGLLTEQRQTLTKPPAAAGGAAGGQ